MEENNSTLEIPINKSQQELQSENTGLDDLLMKYLTSFDNQDSQLNALKHLAQATYSEYPVDMHTFINDPYYLNLKGQVYPILEEDLCELFDPQNNYHEAVLTGGIGFGKTVFSEISIARMVYECSCLKNPQKAYGLSDGSKITFANVSVTMDKAIKTAFDGLANLFTKSPYFRTKFPLQKRTKIEIRFPKNIEIFPTTDPISLNVFGGIIDEANFMEVLVSSAKARGGSYNQAKELHDAFIRRMESRFMERGKLPGILLTLSSAKYNDDFTHELERRSKTDPRIFYRRYSQWSTKPKSFYLGEKFYLGLGNNSDIPPEILYKEEETFSERIQHLVTRGVKVVAVPIEHKLDFENDLHGSIRDIAGYSTQSIRPYITNFAKMLEAAKRGEHLKHPISVTTFMSGDPLFFIEGFKCQNKNPHFCHIDLSLKKDCCGFAVGHVKEYVKVRKKNADGVYSIEDAPYITIDLMLQVKAKRRSEIEIADIRSIIYELQLKGFYFQYVSFDQFQSADSRQILQRKGINTGLLSVDRNTDAYDCLKNAAQEDRIEFYYSEILFKELKCLEFDERRNKVDHPPTGCFTGDTRIALLNGELKSFIELEKEYKDKTFWVYSVNEQNKIVPGLAHSPRKTLHNANLIEICLDNYQIIRCTPTHLFMLLDGTYKEAQYLTRLDSLMPLYRSLNYKGNNKDYERIFQPLTGERDLTHRLVANACLEPLNSSMIVHHIDKNNLNNNPENLQIMTKEEHSRLHTTRRHKEDIFYHNKVKDAVASYAKSEIGRETSRKTIYKTLGIRPKNHRIISIKFLTYTEDVYDITVEKYHNFALSSGVFVHNSKDLADAVAGVCFHCSSQKPAIHTPPSYGLVEKIQPLKNKYPKENDLFDIDKMIEMYPFSTSPNYYHNPDKFYL